ncbi:hypothetical protein ACLBWT_00060 [Paenibacillus sp. D51F]
MTFHRTHKEEIHAREINEGHYELEGELEEYRFKLVLQPRPGLPAAVRCR